jgi:formylglycine-generating enzyme required for sulfatase activity
MLNSLFKLKLSNYENYICFLFIYLININFLVTEKYIIFPSIGSFQFINSNLLENNFLSSIFYLHGQPPLWNFIAGLFLKISKFLGNPIFFHGFLNNANVVNLPLVYQSAAHLIFLIFLFLLPLQALLIYKIFNNFFSNLASYFFVILYLLSPFVIYLTLFISWEFLFSFLLVLLIYLLLFDKYFKKKNTKKYLLATCIVVCSLFLLRSTFKFPIIILISIYLILNFYKEKKNILKFFIIPIFIIYFLICAKNLLIVKKFTIETQSIFHLSHSWGPFLIKDNTYYQNLTESEKKLIKNSNLGFLAGGPSHYKDIGFGIDNQSSSNNKYFVGGNDRVFADTYNSYAKILLHSITSKDFLEFANYITSSVKLYFSWNAGEGIEIISSTFFDKYLFFQNNILKYNFFIISFIFINILFKTFNFNRIVKNKLLFFLFFLDFLILYLILTTGALSANGNSRYRIACEPLYLIYFLINFSELKKYFLEKNISYIVITTVIFLVFINWNNFLFYLNKNDLKKNLTNISSEKKLNLYNKIDLGTLNDKFYFIPESEVLTSPNEIYYFTKSEVRYVDNFYVLKKNVSLGDYILFMEDNSFTQNIPYWWKKNKSVDENIKEYKNFYKINDSNFSKFNYPVTGINFYNASEYARWFSKRYRVNASLINDSQWAKALEFFMKKDKKKFFNTLQSKQQGNHNFSKIIPDLESENNFSDFVGNVWQWVVPQDNIIYALDKRGTWSVNVSKAQLEDDTVYKFISEKYAFLRGGSYTTLGPTAENYASAKLIFGRYVTDEDVGFRIVINK